MKMGEYQALVAYFGVAFVVFVAGIIWAKYRSAIIRKLRIREYREVGPKAPTSSVSH
jgi:hypothetical protein